MLPILPVAMIGFREDIRTSMGDSMKCSQCGFESQGKFCSNCGASLEEQKKTEDKAPLMPVVHESMDEEATVSDEGKNDNQDMSESTSAEVGVQMPSVNSAPSTSSSTAPAKRKASDVVAWVIIVFLVAGFLSWLGGDGADKGKDANAASAESASAVKAEEKDKVTVEDFSQMTRTEIEEWAQENNVTCTFSEDYSDDVSAGLAFSQSKKAEDTVKEGSTIYVKISKGKEPSIEYKNALKKAQGYSKHMHMSKQAIYDQLVSEYGEHFPADAARYAIDNLEADFKENALKKAKSYQDMMSMSKSRIYSQLVSEHGEKFTAEEAQYAIDNL